MDLFTLIRICKILYAVLFTIFTFVRVSTVVAIAKWRPKGRHNIHVILQKKFGQNELYKLTETGSDHYIDGFIGITPLWIMLKDNLMKAWYTEARLGMSAPDVALVNPSDATECRLLELAVKSRPLLVNFGSCS